MTGNPLADATELTEDTELIDTETGERLTVNAIGDMEYGTATVIALHDTGHGSQWPAPRLLRFPEDFIDGRYTVSQDCR